MGDGKSTGVINKVSILRPEDLTPGSLAWAGSPHVAAPDLESVWNAKFTKSNLNKGCMICGSKIAVEMHHVRKIRDLKSDNKLDFFTRQKAAINRKQIHYAKKRSPHRIT